MNQSLMSHINSFAGFNPINRRTTIILAGIICSISILGCQKKLNRNASLRAAIAQEPVPILTPAPDTDTDTSTVEFPVDSASSTPPRGTGTTTDIVTDTVTAPLPLTSFIGATLNSSDHFVADGKSQLTQIIQNLDENGQSCAEHLGVNDGYCNDNIPESYKTILDLTGLPSGSTWHFDSRSKNFTYEFVDKDINRFRGFSLRMFYFNPNTKLYAKPVVLEIKDFETTKPYIFLYNDLGNKTESITPDNSGSFMAYRCGANCKICLVNNTVIDNASNNCVYSSGAPKLSFDSDFVKLATTPPLPSGGGWEFKDNIWTLDSKRKDAIDYAGAKILHYVYNPDNHQLSNPVRGSIAP